MSLVELLAEVGLSESDATEILRVELVAAGRPAALPQSATGFLAEHGGIEPRPSRTDADVRLALSKNAVENMAALVAQSITVEEAAERLDLSPSRVRHRISDGALYGFRLGQRLRLPLFQFGEAGQLLPRVRTVLKFLPEDLHPLAVIEFMTCPNPELEIDRHPTSPAAWLAGGGNVNAVITQASEIDQW